MGYKSVSKPDLESVYTNGFITNKSQQAITNLTNPITLRAGTWVVMVKTPYAIGSGQCLLQFGGLDPADFPLGIGFSTNLSYGTVVTQIKISSEKTVILQSASSTATYTWDSSTLGRGGVFAVRIGD